MTPTTSQPPKPASSIEPKAALTAPEPSASDGLLPNDHVRLLTELLKRGTPELARRWVAALTLVPESEREAVVEAVERQIAGEFSREPEA